MTSETSNYWALARLVKDSSSSSSPSPCLLQVLAPWRLFLGYNSSGAPLLTSDVVDSSLVLQNYHGKVPSYFIPSETDIILCVVGPANASEANIRVHWGDSPTPLKLIIQDGKNRKVNPFTPGINNWASIVLPLSVAGDPDKFGHKGCWRAIEVHTRFDFQAKEGLKMRMEHHAQGRVPPPQCWKSQGGYGAVSPAILEQQFQAAIAWQLAAREVIVDSGWGLDFSAKHGGFLQLMGFETNNPLHDDHAGRGAHWHLASRESAIFHTPHIYIQPDGSLKTDPERNIGWDFGVFGIRACADGSLLLAPLATLRHEASKHHLHVRESLQKDRDPVALWQDQSPGNNMMVIRHSNGQVSLCSTRSWRFLHVLQSQGKAGSPVYQWNKPADIDQGSGWIFDATQGSLRNARSGTYLSVAPDAKDRDSSIQSATPDKWEYISGGATKQSSYAIHVRATMNPGAEVKILKDGQLWWTMHSYDSTCEGKIQMQISAPGKAMETRIINYDPHTGAALESNWPR